MDVFYLIVLFWRHLF